jgi:hypothetical protein
MLKDEIQDKERIIAEMIQDKADTVAEMKASSKERLDELTKSYLAVWQMVQDLRSEIRKLKKQAKQQSKQHQQELEELMAQKQAEYQRDDTGSDACSEVEYNADDFWSPPVKGKSKGTGASSSGEPVFCEPILSPKTSSL